MSAVLDYLDALSDDAAAHIFPDDLQRCATSECTVTVFSVRAGSPDQGHTVPLFNREQVVAALKAGCEMPAMTASLREVLGTPVHTMIPLVRVLQAADPSIESRYESEQAALLHWMLSFWFKHGDDWRKFAAEEIGRMRTQLEANPAVPK